MTMTGMIEEKINIAVGVKVEIDGQLVKVSGPNGKLSREFVHNRAKIMEKEGKIVVSCEMPRVKDKAVVGTFASHIRNMMDGVTSGFEYKMKIVYSHFPIKAYAKGNKFIIENFLGERTPRKADIVRDTKIAVKGNDIVLTGADLEAVSQTAANIERSTKIKKFDSRVFQDGAYIVEKAGRMSK
ncbi:MAG: 50S ribosomal protein L6 [Methanomassiliicoccales archaeon]|nr:50S ribosomal protein L6 [Methanomassiliicoccales archaeon]